MSDYQLWRYLEQYAELRNGWWYGIAALPAIVLAISAYLLMILAMRRQKNLAIAGLWILLAGAPAVLIGPSFYVSLSLGAAAQRIGFNTPANEQGIARAQALQLSAALDQVATLGITGAALSVAAMLAAVILGGYAPQLTRTITETFEKVSETVTKTLTSVVGGGGRKRTVRSPYGKFKVERSATHSGTEHAVRDGIVIGKMNADIIITDPLVSRRHARVHVQDSRVLLEDLGSTNGTFVRRDGRDEELNGTPFELRHGDEVYLGPPDEPDAVVLRYIRES